MSRNEGKIGTGHEAAVGSAELEQLERELARLQRPAAVARYLAAGEGWKEASAKLGGAFAPTAPVADG